MKKLSVFLLSSILSMLLFFCFVVPAQAVDDRQMPSIEVLKTWKPVSTGEKRVTAQSDEEKAKYGKFYIIQYFALISPQSDGDHRQSVSITLIKALDGTVYATATTCHLAWDNKKFPCSFKPEATVVWEMPKTMVAN